MGLLNRSMSDCIRFDVSTTVLITMLLSAGSYSLESRQLSVRKIGDLRYILILRINILIMIKTSDLVTILFVRVQV
jgi:hypothetical protein